MSLQRTEQTLAIFAAMKRSKKKIKRAESDEFYGRYSAEKNRGKAMKELTKTRDLINALLANEGKE